MGSRNINRIPPAIWRGRAEAVWEMIAEGWRIESHCAACRRRRPVDLVAVGKKCGPAYSLWDREPPCKTKGCAGRAIFLARPPGVDLAFSLIAPGAAPEVLKAAGLLNVSHPRS